jgi:conjugal transfer/entry exclusion protein
MTRQIEAVSEQVTVVQNQLHALSHGMFRVKSKKIC